MDGNYILALQKYLQDDAQINAIVGDRIGFLRMTEGTQKPCIVFNEQERIKDNYSNAGYQSGIDIFPVLIDVVVDYKDSIIGRNLRQLIRKKLGNFKGILSQTGLGIDWSGMITFERFLACDFNQETDSLIWGGLYIFKQGYDYTDI